MAVFLDLPPFQNLNDLAKVDTFVPPKEDTQFLGRHQKHVSPLLKPGLAIPTRVTPTAPLISAYSDSNPKTYFLHPVFRFAIQSEQSIKPKAMEWIQKRLALALDLPPSDVNIVPTPQPILEGLDSACGPKKEKPRDLYQEWPDQVLQLTTVFRLFSYQSVWNLLAQEGVSKWRTSLCSQVKREMSQIAAVTTNCEVESYIGLFPISQSMQMKEYENNPIQTKNFLLKAHIGGKNLKSVQDLIVYVLTKRIPLSWPTLVGTRGIKIQGPLILTQTLIQGTVKQIAPPPPLPEVKCPMHKVPAEVVLQIGGTSSVPVSAGPTQPIAQAPSTTTSSSSSVSSTASSSTPSPSTSATTALSSLPTQPPPVVSKGRPVGRPKVAPTDPKLSDDDKVEVGKKAKQILDSKEFDEDERPILEAQINEMKTILDKQKAAAAAGPAGATMAAIAKGGFKLNPSGPPREKTALESYASGPKVDKENERIGSELKINHWYTKNKGQITLYLNIITKKFRVDYDFPSSL